MRQLILTMVWGAIHIAHHWDSCLDVFECTFHYTVMILLYSFPLFLHQVSKKEGQVGFIIHFNFSQLLFGMMAMVTLYIIVSWHNIMALLSMELCAYRHHSRLTGS